MGEDNVGKYLVLGGYHKGMIGHACQLYNQ